MVALIELGRWPEAEAALDELPRNEHAAEQAGAAQALHGWLAMTRGDVAQAESWFAEAGAAADSARSRPAWDPLRAEYLRRTERSLLARALAERARRDAVRRRLPKRMARCDVVLARLDLTDGDPASAAWRLRQAAEVWGRAPESERGAAELAAVAVERAELARATGDRAGAERHAEQALGLAERHRRPGLRAAALAEQAAQLAEARLIREGRAAAQAALAAATEPLRFPWAELAAMRAHAVLDRYESADHGWAGRAAALRAGLLPLAPPHG